MAKGLSPAPELPPGGAMHSNVREKSNGLGMGFLARNWALQSPAGKTEWSSSPFQAPLLRPWAPELRQGHPRCSS